MQDSFQLVSALAVALLGGGSLLGIYRRRNKIAAQGVGDDKLPSMFLNEGVFVEPNEAARRLLRLRDDRLLTHLLMSDEECREFRRRVDSCENFSMPVDNALTGESFSLRGVWQGERLKVEMLPDSLARQNRNYVRIRDNITGITDGAVITDTALRVTDHNRRYCEITGFESEGLKGTRISRMRSGRHNDTFYRSVWKQLATLGHWSGQIWCARLDGTYYLQRLSISEIRNEQGVVTHYLGLLTNLSEELSRSAAPALSTPDEQDRVMNRFVESIGGRDYDVIQIDIERYTLIRDTFGDELGERLLMAFESRLRRQLPEHSLCVRSGRDEFSVLVRSESDMASQRFASGVIEQMTEAFVLDGLDLQVPINIGIAHSGESPNLYSTRLAASTALYRARRKGLNTFEVYHPEQQQQQLYRLRMESRLRQAIANNELKLVYQPIVDSKGELVKAEALLRWNCPEEGAISPAVFIPIAEASGLIDSIGNWVINEACRELRAWRDQGYTGVRVAINISSYQLRDEHLIDHIRQTLDRHAIEPNCLELEITETALMEQLDQANQLLSDCRKLGLKLAIDDFGTGYSSLAYLKNLAVDTLKIDRSFVASIAHDNPETTILDMIIQLAQQLNLQTVAEGIETLEQANHLRRLGCDLYQGFLIARPKPAHELTSWLARSRVEGDDEIGTLIQAGGGRG